MDPAGAVDASAAAPADDPGTLPLPPPPTEGGEVALLEEPVVEEPPVVVEPPIKSEQHSKRWMKAQEWRQGKVRPRPLASGRKNVKFSSHSYYNYMWADAMYDLREIIGVSLKFKWTRVVGCLLCVHTN
jgi:hypothetical protein